MTTDSGRLRRLLSLFEAVCKLEVASDRDAFLDRECAGNPELRAELARMLASMSGDGTETDDVVEAMQRGVDAAFPDLAIADSWTPERLAGYEIVRRIGSGGMGVVYEGLQQSPRRRVALKVLHAQQVTPDRLRRFRQEAELLGRLQHPGIAQVHEAATFDAGRGELPFFAMELVDGVDLRSYCERDQLDTAARLELIARVCDAVQFAHDRSVIHRDIKPENVLVDPFGQPKVLDFGIAHTHETSTLLSTVVTQEGQLVGTLTYMAPEQLGTTRGEVTPLVDVFALGVLAFEVLTGELPHDVAELPVALAITKITSTEPRRASAIDASLRGDVDTILRAALESNPARRYASAADLAADIRAFLEHRPIEARPPSRTYLFRKFARRNGTLVAGVTATLVVLLGGGVAAYVLAGIAEDRAREAHRNEVAAAAGLLQSAENQIDAARWWDALAQHELVPAATRGWAWRLQARMLPRVLDVPVIMTPEVWRFWDDDHLWVLDTANDRVLVKSLVDALPPRALFAGMGLDRIGLLRRTGIAAALRGAEVLVLDFNTEEVLARLPCDPTGFRPRISDDGRVVTRQPERGVQEVCVDGEPRFRMDAPGRFDVSPDGNLVVELRSDRSFRALDLATGRELLRRDAEPPETEISGYPRNNGVVFLYEGRGSNRRIRRGDVVDGALVFGEINLQPELTSVVRFPDDGRFISPSLGSSTVFRDTRTGELLRLSHFQDDREILQYGRNPGSGVEVSPSGTRLAVVGARQPWIVDLDPRAAEPDYDPRCLPLRGHTSWIYHVAVSHDGRHVASSAPRDRSVRVWSTATGEQVAAVERLERGVESWDALLAFSPDDLRVVFTAPCEGQPGVCVVSWRFGDGEVQLHSPEEPLQIANHVPLLDHFIDVLRPGPRDRLGHKAQLIDGRALTVWREDSSSRGVTPIERGRHWRQVKSDPDGRRWVALSAHPHEPWIAIVHEGRGIPNQVRDRRASSSGVVVRSVTTGETVADIPLPFEEQPMGIAYSPDGALLAVGLRSGHVAIIETELHTVQLRFRAHRSYVYSLVWLPDGERLVTASGDKTLRIWDATRR